MSGQAQFWMPAILALFGSLIVVSFTAWINTRAVLAHIEVVRAELGALRAEFKKDLAEFELRLNTRLSALEHRIERLEEQLGLVRP